MYKEGANPRACQRASKMLLIGGGQKCGTTWLHHTLAYSPDFYCPPVKDELHFFDRDFEKGFDYYLGLFSGAKNHQVCVDVTPDYLGHSKFVAERLKLFEQLSGVQLRIVFILRDPVERFISAYNMEQRKRRVDKSGQPIHLDCVVQYGLYHMHLSLFRHYFSSDQMKVFLFEEFFNNPEKSLEELRRFADVDGTIATNFIRANLNIGGVSRYPWLTRSLSNAGWVARGIGCRPVVHYAKQTRAFNYFQKRCFKKINKADSDGAKASIEMGAKDRYVEDVRMLDETYKSLNLRKFWPQYFDSDTY